ncbi:NAD(P)H-dependent oxidoreductase [Amycolatopsis sp. GM8]|uniref:NAD(P)H-dependent oxidoreductase n=1 Tax=Amycolatopsis sp. GM8 TaxID=2896530 RepID=UPI001EFFA015|nr:NAD(P)H-dependent oxidoreductase [Amycolatopsis sp. GM8]
MITALLASSTLMLSHADRPAATLRGFTTQLTGAPPVRELALPADSQRLHQAVAGADVVVIGASAHTSTLDEATRLAIEHCARNDLLAGKVVFAVVIGGWPAAAGTVPDGLTAALSAAGAIAVAPALHLAGGQQDARPAVATFCKFWAPALPALLQLSRADSARPSAA